MKLLMPALLSIFLSIFTLQIWTMFYKFKLKLEGAILFLLSCVIIFVTLTTNKDNYSFLLILIFDLLILNNITYILFLKKKINFARLTFGVFFTIIALIKYFNFYYAAIILPIVTAFIVSFLLLISELKKQKQKEELKQ